MLIQHARETFDLAEGVADCGLSAGRRAVRGVFGFGALAAVGQMIRETSVEAMHVHGVMYFIPRRLSENSNLKGFHSRK